MILWDVVLFRLALSVALGALVGIEREAHGKPAGLRTHVLVCLGSSLIMIVSLSVKGDPGRIAAQVVSGIGFLGAGTIIMLRGSVVGLTTAASLWSMCGVGLSVGCGLYAASLTAVGLILFILIAFDFIEKKLAFGTEYKEMTLKVRANLNNFSIIPDSLKKLGIKVKKFEFHQLEGTDQKSIILGAKVPYRLKIEDVAQELSSHKEIELVELSDWR
jgi:putative Mg2+ transporter-C (MgtC) family protein